METGVLATFLLAHPSGKFGLNDPVSYFVYAAFDLALHWEEIPTVPHKMRGPCRMREVTPFNG